MASDLSLGKFCSYPVIESRYSIEKVIGKGSYGAVVKATDNITNNKVAIKLIPNVDEDVVLTKRSLREVLILNALDQKNILCLHDAKFCGKSLFLITEYCEIDLHQLTYSKQNSKALLRTRKDFLSILFQMLKGISFVHSAGVIHRDIKPANVLIDKHLNVKLCDFGFARTLPNGSVSHIKDTEKTPMTEYMASRWYRAPELVLNPGLYGKAQDIWSIACSYAEFLTKSVLFPGQHTIHQIQIILDVLGKPTERDLDFEMSSRCKTKLIQMGSMEIGLKNAISCTPAFHKDLFSLMEGMLQFNPLVRLSGDEALSKPIFHRFESDPTPELVPENIQKCGHYEAQLVTMTRKEELNRIMSEAVDSIQQNLQNKYYYTQYDESVNDYVVGSLIGSSTSGDDSNQMTQGHRGASSIELASMSYSSLSTAIKSKSTNDLSTASEVKCAEPVTETGHRKKKGKFSSSILFSALRVMFSQKKMKNESSTDYSEDISNTDKKPMHKVSSWASFGMIRKSISNNTLLTRYSSSKSNVDLESMNVDHTASKDTTTSTNSPPIYSVHVNYQNPYGRCMKSPLAKA
mmetsp:Transcript_22642/g.22841  ORF Transcript_22642/g.22841 Transcript_22642/m.22841 type:complete len:575 (-) Transcript_22642:303-2027(-)|eukprot:CAMPEP_0182429176 /NCGR_PEP_ID=MMETSP1167-20130531/25569_1 /TAXON_ID=2988 /ORGANISM="Mallomonas Sp, Strain CCMP3275" /LENGTH=574 /DNA_ID=CAMNT_0024612545 /DNA_START=56 /DNA_END=1780 /DNA_ORIENTATION=+